MERRLLFNSSTITCLLQRWKFGVSYTSSQLLALDTLELNFCAESMLVNFL